MMKAPAAWAATDGCGVQLDLGPCLLEDIEPMFAPLLKECPQVVGYASTVRLWWQARNAAAAKLGLD